ncbi:MAG: hypothetical protein WBB83_03420 [Candidatus Microthrix parvicella]|jgi:hypothetical protein
MTAPEAHAEPDGRAPWQRVPMPLVVVVGGLLLTLVVWGPLILRGGGTLLDPGDPVFEAWNLDWVQHAVTSDDKLFDANIFAPTPDTLAYSDTRIAPALVTLPVRWLGGSPTTVVNAALLIGVVANFAAAWWAGWTLRRSHLAGAVMGVVYAFGPLPSFFMLHVHMTWRMGLPLAVVGIWRLLDQDDGERPDILGCLALASAALVSIGTSVYQAGFLALTVVVVLAVRHRNLSWRRFGAVVSSLAVGAIPCVPIALAHLRVLNSGEVASYGLAAVAALSAQVGQVDSRVLVWRRWLGPKTPADRLLLPMFAGLAPLLGAAAGWFGWGRTGRTQRSLGLALVLLGAVLGFGLSDTGWRRFTPMRLLFELPGFDAIRGAGRYWTLALLGLAVLCAGAVMWLDDALVRRRGAGMGARVALAGALLLIPIVEGWPDLSDLPTASVTPLDHQLAEGTGTVAYLPLNIADDGIDFIPQHEISAVFRSTAHHRPILNGYSGTFPQSFIIRSNALKDLPSPAAMAELKRLGVTDVVVTPAVAGTPWAGLLNPDDAGTLELVGIEPNGDVHYRVP